MKLDRSDSPEVIRLTASAGARASWRFPTFVYGFSLNILMLLIAVAVSQTVSMRVAVWFGVSVFLAWNVYVLWLLKSPRRNWVIAADADRVCIRLGVNDLEAIILEVSEIASMSIRTAEVFLYGPKPKFVELLIIEPVSAQSEDVFDRVSSFQEGCRDLNGCGTLGSRNPSRVAKEDGRLIIEWKWCHPSLRVFVRQVMRVCPSLVIGPDEHSELDLNGIWNNARWEWRKPDQQQRQMLVQAKRLGLGSDCIWFLHLYKRLSFQEAKTYLAEIEREEAGAGHSTI